MCVFERGRLLGTCLEIEGGMESLSAIDTYRKNGYEDQGRGFGIVFFYSCPSNLNAVMKGISVNEYIERERKETRPYIVSKASIECTGLVEIWLLRVAL
jgi:hypothetical protein